MAHEHLLNAHHARFRIDTHREKNFRLNVACGIGRCQERHARHNNNIATIKIKGPPPYADQPFHWKTQSHVLASMFGKMLLIGFHRRTGGQPVSRSTSRTACSLAASIICLCQRKKAIIGYIIHRLEFPAIHKQQAAHQRSKQIFWLGLVINRQYHAFFHIPDKASPFQHVPSISQNSLSDYSSGCVNGMWSGFTLISKRSSVFGTGIRFRLWPAPLFRSVASGFGKKHAPLS